MKVSVVSATVVLFAAISVVLCEPPSGNAAAGGPYPPSGWKPSGRAFLLPARQAPRDSYTAPPTPGQYGPPPPKPSYGPPPPKPSYGPPSTTEAATTEQPTTTEETTEAVTEEPEYEDDAPLEVDTPAKRTGKANAGGNAGPNAFASANAYASADARAFARASAEPADGEDAATSGLYFVLLPDGRLQRVAYTTSRDQSVFERLVAEPAPQNAGFLAIQYQDVSPVQAPVYSYGPDNALLRIY